MTSLRKTALVAGVFLEVIVPTLIQPAAISLTRKGHKFKSCTAHREG